MIRYWTLRGLAIVQITGIIIMAGTTMIDYLTYKTFWALADQGDRRMLGLMIMMEKYGALIRTGGIMIIISGISILILEKAVRLHERLFRIKLGLFFLILLNGILVGNKQGHQLREVATENISDFMQCTMQIRETMDRFYPIQLALYFLILSTSTIRLVKHANKFSVKSY